MRKRVAVVAGAVLVAGAAAVTAVTAVQADATSDHHGFTVVERALTDTTTDTGAKGDSVGDLLTFANPIYDRTNATKIGSDNGACTRTVAGSTYECAWTTTLPGGSLVVEGPFYDTRDSTLAIIGGTGKWAKAHGEMTLHARDAASTSYDFTFSVR